MTDLIPVPAADGRRVMQIASLELLTDKTRAEELGYYRTTTQRGYVDAWANFGAWAMASTEQEQAAWRERDYDREAALAWLQGHLRDVTHHDLILYRTVLLQTLGLAPATVAMRLAGIHKLFTIARREGLVDHSPADTSLVSRPKTKGRPQRHVLELDEVMSVIEAHPPEDAILCRNQMLFRLLAWTGIRRQEAAELIHEDIQTASEGTLLYLRRKGNKQDSILLPKKLEAYLFAYLEALEPERFLFPSARRLEGRVIILDRPVTPDRITTIIRAMTEAVLGTAYGPHRLRHFFANEAYDNGVPVEQIQHYLGHDSATTTMTYIQLKPRRAKSAAEALDLS